MSVIHWSRAMHICVSKVAQHWFIYWIVVYSAPSHYLNQCRILTVESKGTYFNAILFEDQSYHSRKCFWKRRLGSHGHFVSAPMYLLKEEFSLEFFIQGSKFCVVLWTIQCQKYQRRQSWRQITSTANDGCLFCGLILHIERGIRRNVKQYSTPIISATWR